MIQMAKQMALPRNDMMRPKSVKTREVMKKMRTITNLLMARMTLEGSLLYVVLDEVYWSSIVMIGRVMSGPFDTGSIPIKAHMTTFIH